jgi:transposase
MAMGREGDRQGDLIVTWAEIPRSPGHVFYDRLQEVLITGGFDRFVETACQPYYAPKMGAPSVPPGRYFRMHMVGYFEGLASERGIAWRCSDSNSLREFLRLENREKVPDHSWLSKTRGRLPHEVHATVFGWVLKLVAEKGLIRGKRIGVDASTMEANAALRTIVRRDDGRTYREMLTQMARESGVDTPMASDLVRIDRARQGKRLSNEEWTSKTDPEAKIAKLKDGRTHLAYKPEHAVDLDTGVIVAAALHPADQGDTTTIAGTLAAAEKNLAQISAAPTKDEPSELVADKGYHARAVLKTLDDGVWKTRIAEPKQPGFSRWHGDDKARAAVYANRTRLGSGVGKQAMRRRAEIVERSFVHNLDRGGMRQTWLRGRENVHKRYLIHVAGHNLSILMRLLIGAGTPREAAARAPAYFFFVSTEQAAAIILVAASSDGFAILAMPVTAAPT